MKNCLLAMPRSMLFSIGASALDRKLSDVYLILTTNAWRQEDNTSNNAIHSSIMVTKITVIFWVGLFNNNNIMLIICIQRDFICHTCYLFILSLFIGKHVEDISKGRSLTGFMAVTLRHQSIQVVWTFFRPNCKPNIVNLLCALF